MAHLRRQCTFLYKHGSNNLKYYIKGQLLKRKLIFDAHLRTKQKYSSTQLCYLLKFKTENLIVRSPYPDIVIPSSESFADLIWKCHGKWKHNTALECGRTGTTYTYSELLNKAEKIGRGLLNEGLKSGDVLSILLPNTLDYVAIILGASKMGITICPINPDYTSNEIGYQVQNSGSKCIITFPDKLNEALKAVEDLAIAEKVIGSIQVISTRVNDKDTNLPSQVKSLEEIINSKQSENCADQIKNHSLTNYALISHSSGTGKSKGVQLTFNNLTASMLQLSTRPITCFRETTDAYQDVIPMVLPLFHNYALIFTMASLYHGSKVIIIPKFEEESYLSTLTNNKVTALFTSPPMMHFIASKENVTEEHLRHVRLIYCAGATISGEDVLRTMKKAPSAHFIQAYGQTGATCGVTQIPYGIKDYTSVGLPLVNTEIKVVDTENGSLKGPLQEGEICFRGPQASPGYLHESKNTNELIDNDGWHHSGDIGYYNVHSYFYIIDKI